MRWDPSRYLGFAAERVRPALDLLARVPLAAPRRIVDLGCGAGNVTRLLAQRWPDADLLGVDSSPEMLARARRALPADKFVQADITVWRPSAPVDLLFSNAALHWLADHQALFARLSSWLAPDGCLAVQMPASFELPSHTTAREVARLVPFRRWLSPDVLTAGVEPPERYLEWLAPEMRRLDAWQSTYLHILEGPDPITEWFKSTLLLPYLEALPEAQRGPFVAAYAQRVRAAHPPLSDGRTVMPMRRFFLVATR